MAEPPHRDLVCIQTPKVHRDGSPSTSGCNTTKSPEPANVDKQKQENTKDQQERASKNKKCALKFNKCSQPAASGRQYCYRHILEDPTTPFSQCNHKYDSGQQCPWPALANPEDPKEPILCFKHNPNTLKRKMDAAQSSTVVIKEHNMQPEPLQSTSGTSSVTAANNQATDKDKQVQSNSQLGPIIEGELRNVYTRQSPVMGRPIISESDTDGDSDSDDDDLTHGNMFNADDDDLSDAEAALEQEYPLANAGVMTPEEALNGARHTMLSLRACYLRQMDNLLIQLQLARIEYLKNLKIEREQCCSISDQIRRGQMTDREKRKLQKLRAYASYHKKHGAAIIKAMKKQYKRNRKHKRTHSGQPVSLQRLCMSTENGIRCQQQVLPAAKYCIKHILNDKFQVLFAPCGDTSGVNPCQAPIAKLPLPKCGTCPLHAKSAAVTDSTPSTSSVNTETPSCSGIASSNKKKPQTNVSEDTDDSQESFIEVD